MAEPLGFGARLDVWAIVVAAGEGRRFGSAKQYAMLGGQRVVDRAVEVALRATAGVVLVLPPGSPWDGPPVAVVTDGGATRSRSVRAGLACVPESAEVVVVHDAARPLASVALFEAVVEAVVAGAVAAVPGVPVADTLKRAAGGVVTGTLDRQGLYAVQTPQAFRAGALRAVHAAGGEATDDAALVEAAGEKVILVAGEDTNLKLTSAADLAVAAALLGER
ncbi:MAG: 2-C-methyl-D-erythritol 4-phosphate cytidylyltransferase [Acidimicrobiia bacterium]